MAKILFLYINVQFRYYIAGGIEEFKLCCPTLILLFCVNLSVIVGGFTVLTGLYVLVIGAYLRDDDGVPFVKVLTKLTKLLLLQVKCMCLELKAMC